MQQIYSTSSSSADIPFPNILNTHCAICSHPIAHSDISVLEPCCCGPFHNYCITNLELQAREANPSNRSPHLQCPRCHFTVTAITFNFVDQVPRSTRPPFTTSSSSVSARPRPASSPIPCPRPSQSLSHPLLPAAIHDLRPSSPPCLRDNRTWSPYPNPTTPPIPPQYSPTHKPKETPYNNFQESSSFPPYPAHRPPLSSQPLPPPPPPLPPPIVPEPNLYHSSYPPQTRPTAPPMSQHEPFLPPDINDCFPPLPEDFKPRTSNKTRQPLAHLNRKRQVSNFEAESRTKSLADRIDLPSPHDAIPPSPTPNKPRRRQQPQAKTQPKANSPNTIVIRRHVSEEDVRKGLYGDDVYKAYVEGTAKLIRESPPDVKRQTCSKNVKVKIEMDVHVYHHYKPRSAFPDATNDRAFARDKERRKAKPAERSWWKSPRAASLLDARERKYRDRRYYARENLS